MNTSLHRNPLDIFIDTLNTSSTGEPTDIKTRAYAYLPVRGRLNASLVGYAVREVINNAPAEASGIDGLNEALAAQSTDESISGIEPSMDNNEIIAHLISIRDALARELNLSDNLIQSMGAIEDTLDFMAKPRTSDDTAISQLAKALELEEDDVRAAAAKMAEDDAKRISANRDAVLSLLNEVNVTENEGKSLDSFNALPARLRSRIVDALAKSLAKQATYATTSVLRGNLDAAASLPILKAASKEIGEWITLACQNDPEFELAHVQG